MGMYVHLYAFTPDEYGQLISDPDHISQLLFAPENAPHHLSLEKAWHGLHFLLTFYAGDNEPPLNFICAGGSPFFLSFQGSEFDPPRLFDEDETVEIHCALMKISDESLWAGFDEEKMTEEAVYPDCWGEPEEDLREEYLSYFRELKEFFADAANNRKTVMIALT